MYVIDIETTGLYPTDNVITAIGIKEIDAEPIIFYNEGNEQKILDRFYKYVVDNIQNKSKIITYNGKRFDIPFIIVRSAMFGSYLRNLMPLVLSDIGHIDLIKYTSFLSLNNAAKQNNIQTKSGNGKDAIMWWRTGQKERLIEYLKQDLRVTEDLFKKLSEKKLIKEVL